MMLRSGFVIGTDCRDGLDPDQRDSLPSTNPVKRKRAASEDEILSIIHKVKSTTAIDDNELTPTTLDTSTTKRELVSHLERKRNFRRVNNELRSHRRSKSGNLSVDLTNITISGRPTAMPLSKQLKMSHNIISVDNSYCESAQKNIDDFRPSNLTYDATHARSIFSMKCSQEVHCIPTLSVFDSIQSEVTGTMRAVLVDWLIEISDEYVIHANTLYLTIHLIDKVLSIMPIKKLQFQLLGCACLVIASKLEEIQPPFMSNLVEVAANCFNFESLVQMEGIILNQLDFDVNLPTRFYFLDRLLFASADITKREIACAYYLLELSLLEHSFAYHPMSKVAAAVLHLTRQLLRPLNEIIWTPILASSSNYDEISLIPLIKSLTEFHYFYESTRLKAVGRKYSTPIFHKVSHIIALKPHQLRFTSPASLTHTANNNNNNNNILLKPSKSLLLVEPKTRNHNQVIGSITSDAILTTHGIPTNHVENHIDILDIIKSEVPALLLVNDIICDKTYANTIFENKVKLELQCIPTHSNVFGSMQPDLTETMRAILVDWLIEISDEYVIHANTLFLTIHLIDKVLCSVPVTKSQFQLLGCACLIIASKLEEIQPPTMSNLLTVVSSSVLNMSSLIEMEQKVLRLLFFDINLPTRYYFLDRILSALPSDFSKREIACANYLLELSLLDYSFAYYPMSQVAAGVIHLTRQMLRPRGCTIWTTTLFDLSGYQENDLQSVVTLLSRMHFNYEYCELRTISRKYETATHLAIAAIPVLKETELRFNSKKI